MSTTPSGASKRSHTASYPCPICKGHEGMPRGQGMRCHGYTLGNVAYCARDQKNTGSAPYDSDTKLSSHILTGDCLCGEEHAPAESRPGVKAKTKVVATYDYRLPDESLLFQVQRKQPKGFVQRRPDPDKKGDWLYKLDGVTRIPYRLPELVKADHSEPVYIVEGEKDADRLAKFGLIASCNPGGTGMGWRDSYSQYFKGRHVVIIGDNDQAGRDHAEKVAKALSGIAASVKVLELPGLAERGDVSDWLNGKHSIADLKAAAEAAPFWTPHNPASEEESDSEPLALAAAQSRNGHSGSNGNGHAHPPFNPRIPLQDTQAKPERFRLTDLGNAERLIHRHGANLGYCHPWKKWLTYDGKRWVVDNTAAARRWAKETARSIYLEAVKEENEDDRKKIVRHAFDTEKRDRIAAMLNLAEMDCSVLPEDLDLHPWSFNVMNGTLDLKTGKLGPHRREDYITKMCRIVYDPQATCPLWESTLDLFFNGDTDLIRYWQKLSGYAMAGQVRDHIMPVAYGVGSNGKSTVLGTLLDVFGRDYAMKCMPDLLMAKKTDSHPTDRADLFGKRLVVAIETEAGKRLNETQVKEFTGGDPIRARRMREDPWEFIPSHTLIMGTNHKPVIRGTDNGIWRRLKLVPFAVTVDGDQADKEMPEKLRAEHAGILAWCVRGCLDWQAHGLGEPTAVTEATAEYRQEQDVLGAFLEEHTMKNASFTVKANVLFKSFSEWAAAANEIVPSMTMFGRMIEERGFRSKRSNGIVYQGIGLRSASDDSEKPYPY
jgi:putative DNA primase/helicase